jgi:outer membrane protein
MPRLAIIAAWISLAAAGLGGRCRAETLADAWAQALSMNPQLAAVQLEEAAAHHDRAAVAADRWPQAWVQGSYAVRNDERSFRLANPFAPGTQFVAPYSQREAAGAAAGVTLPLYTGGEITSAVQSADARAAASIHGSAASRLQLLLAVSEAFVAVLRNQCDLVVSEQNLASLTAHAADVQKNHDQQRVSRSDVLSAQVAAAGAEQLRLRRLHQLEAARGEYNRLLTRPLDAPVALDEVNIAPVALSLEELQQSACAQRPDLAQLAATVEARQLEAERLRGEARPHVNAVGRYDFEENRYQTPQAITSAAVVVDWNVFDAGQSRRAACAEATRAASVGKLADDLRSRVALEVLTEWNSVEDARARCEVAARAFDQAEENFRCVSLRYAEGAAVQTDVLDAQARRIQAASDYHNAGYDWTIAQLRLRYAAGILGNGQ